MIKKRSFTKHTVILQVFLLLFALAMIPVVSASETFPLIAGGEVTIDGEAAPVGTEITVMLGEDVVSTISTVETEGLYGDLPNNRLLITCEPENYEYLKFYVNGIEADIFDKTDLKNAAPLDEIELSLTAETAPGVEVPADEPIGDPASGGSSAGTSSTYSSSTDNAGVQANSVSDGESTFESTAFAGEESASGATASDVPASEAQSSATTFGLLALILAALVGIIAFLKYRSGV